MVEGELGAFLRSRREATSPESVGLPVGSRRRTPGLRRAELATLAGVSVDYLIRIEQGRDTNPSPQVLGALADVLGLDEDEKAHLRHLVVASQGPELCPGLRPAAQEVRPTVRALLDRLDPTPAVVLNHLSDLLAWTNGYAALVGPLGILEATRPNLVAYTFTDERARRAFPDWDDMAHQMAASLHAEQRAPGDDARTFAEHLQQEAGFTERWEACAVAPLRSGVQAIDHPAVGVLRLAFEVLDLPDPDRQRLVTYLPADEATATGLDRLAGRTPGHLRAVAPA